MATASPQSEAPLYQQIAAQLRGEIEAGRLAGRATGCRRSASSPARSA